MKELIFLHAIARGLLDKDCTVVLLSKKFMRNCERCTEEIVNYVHELCIDCYAIIGTKPNPTDEICYYCGSQWVSYNQTICSDCFIKEMPYNQIQI